MWPCSTAQTPTQHSQWEILVGRPRTERTPVLYNMTWHHVTYIMSHNRYVPLSRCLKWTWGGHQRMRMRYPQAWSVDRCKVWWTWWCPICWSRWPWERSMPRHHWRYFQEDACHITLCYVMRCHITLCNGTVLLQVLGRILSDQKADAWMSLRIIVGPLLVPQFCSRNYYYYHSQNK